MSLKKSNEALRINNNNWLVKTSLLNKKGELLRNFAINISK